MKWLWILLAMTVTLGFISSGKATLPKCHKEIACNDECHSEGGVHRQCKKIGDQKKAAEDKCGAGIPGGSQCGEVYTTYQGSAKCTDGTGDYCGGEYYKSGACSG